MFENLKIWIENLFKETKSQIVSTNEKVASLLDKKESNHQNPYLYFSAGLSLNDKDRDNNHDSSEIQRFFKPIDTLFGDYEIRKKFGFHNQIYRKRFFECNSREIVDFDNEKTFKNLKVADLNKRKDFRLYLEENGKVIDAYKAKDFLLLVVLIYDIENKDSFVECFKTSAVNLLSRESGEIHKLLEEQVGHNSRIIQVFVVDPEKLIHAAKLDSARQEFYRDALCKNEDIELETLNEVLNNYLEAKYLGEVEDYPNKIIEPRKNYDIFNFDSYDNDKTNKKYEVVELFRKRIYKLKNFEAHEYFRIRVGFEDNHYVLFFHPYESESNNPIRFPPGGQ